MSPSFTVVLVSIEKIYQTLVRVFHHISLEVRQKYSTARRIFNSLLGVWKCDETLSIAFDILLSTFEHLTAPLTGGVQEYIFTFGRKAFIDLYPHTDVAIWVPCYRVEANVSRKYPV